MKLVLPLCFPISPFSTAATPSSPRPAAYCRRHIPTERFQPRHHHPLDSPPPTGSIFPSTVATILPLAGAMTSKVDMDTSPVPFPLKPSLPLSLCVPSLNVDE